MGAVARVAVATAVARVVAATGEATALVVSTVGVTAAAGRSDCRSRRSRSHVDSTSNPHLPLHRRNRYRWRTARARRRTCCCSRLPVGRVGAMAEGAWAEATGAVRAVVEAVGIDRGSRCSQSPERTNGRPTSRRHRRRRCRAQIGSRWCNTLRVARRSSRGASRARPRQMFLTSGAAREPRR